MKRYQEKRAEIIFYHLCMWYNHFITNNLLGKRKCSLLLLKYVTLLICYQFIALYHHTLTSVYLAASIDSQECIKSKGFGYFHDAKLLIVATDN